MGRRTKKVWKRGGSWSKSTAEYILKFYETEDILKHSLPRIVVVLQYCIIHPHTRKLGQQRQVLSTRLHFTSSSTHSPYTRLHLKPKIVCSNIAYSWPFRRMAQPKEEDEPPWKKPRTIIPDTGEVPREICSICLEELGDQGHILELSCAHQFCLKCMMNPDALELRSCPLCRSDYYYMNIFTREQAKKGFMRVIKDVDPITCNLVANEFDEPLLSTGERVCSASQTHHANESTTKDEYIFSTVAEFERAFPKDCDYTNCSIDLSVTSLPSPHEFFYKESVEKQLKSLLKRCRADEGGKAFKHMDGRSLLEFLRDFLAVWVSEQAPPRSEKDFSEAKQAEIYSALKKYHSALNRRQWQFRRLRRQYPASSQKDLEERMRIFVLFDDSAALIKSLEVSPDQVSRLLEVHREAIQNATKVHEANAKPEDVLWQAKFLVNEESKAYQSLPKKLRIPKNLGLLEEIGLQDRESDPCLNLLSE